MPLDQYDTGVDRRLKKQQEQTQANVAGDPYHQITTVDNAARKTLSTDKVLYLAGLSQESAELARLGRLMAHNFAVSPRWVFNQLHLKDYTNPATGSAYTVQDARVFTDNYGEVAITSILANSNALTYNTGASGVKGPHVGTTTSHTLDARQVGAFARAIADRTPGIEMSQALSMAIYLGKQGFKPAAFNQNLEFVRRWQSMHPEQAGKSDNPEAQALNMATLITSTGRRVKSVNDVTDAIYGRGARTQSEALQRHLSTIQQVESGPSQGMYYSPDAPGAFFNSKEEAEQGIIASYQESAMHMSDATPVEQLTPDYFAQVQDQAASLKAQSDAFENSWFNHVIVKPGGYLLRQANTLYQDTTAVIYGATGAFYAPLTIAYGQDPREVFSDALSSTQRMLIAPNLKGEYDNVHAPTVGQVLTEPLPEQFHFLAGPADFIIGWYLDPFVLAGKGTQAFREARILPGILEKGADTGNVLEATARAVAEGGAAAGEGVGKFGGWVNTVKKFAKSGVSKKMFEGDDTYLQRSIFRLRGVYEARGTLDPAYMTALKRRIEQVFPKGTPDDIIQEYRRLQERVVGTEKAVEFLRGESLHPPEGAMTGKAWKKWSLEHGYSEEDVKVFDQWLRLNKKLGITAEHVDEVRAGAATVSDPTLRELAKLRKEEAWQAWQEGILTHYTGYAPDGTIAHQVLEARLNGGFRNRAAVEKITPERWEKPLTPLDEAQLVPQYPLSQDVPHYFPETGTYDAITHAQAMQYDASGAFIKPQVMGVPLRVEVPGRSVLARYGPRRLLRSAVTSEEVTSTAIGRKLAALPNMNPGRIADINDNPALYIYEHATRAGIYTDSQARALAKRMIDAQNSGVGIESKLQEIVDEVNDDLFKHLTKNYTITEGELDALKGAIFDPQTSINNRFRSSVFGAGGKPILESQLQNTYFVMDPLEVRAGIREYISIRDRLGTTFKRYVKNEVSEVHPILTKADADLLHKMAVGGKHGARNIFEGWLRWWKTYTVARPAYVTRVVLGDENLRYLATTQSLGDRMLAIAFGHRAAEDQGMLKRFLDDHFSREFKIGNDTVFLPRAGAYEYESAAAGAIRQADIINEVMRGNAKFNQVLKADGSWKMLEPSNKNAAEHLSAWSWDLTMQARNSAPGRAALELIAAGKVRGPEDIAIRLKQWARDDNYRTLITRIGRKKSEVNEWADDLSKMMYNYTLGNPEIARLSLEGNRKWLEQAMKNLVPEVEKRPIVHSPVMQESTDGSLAQRTAEKFYSWFVRQPEDSLNRQPYYAVWKRRAEASMTAMAVSNGAELTPELKLAIDHASKDFALGQVRRVMFDFTKQSRFTEMLQLVFPFPQPFFEGFQAWGHIAWRNPTAIAHGLYLFNQGKESGFLKKDPLSGEWMVPFGVVRGPMAYISTMFGTDPKLANQIDSPWIPLSSMNMLTSTTVPVAGIGIPVPSPHVLWTALAQKALKNTTSPFIQGYLFQYGPETQLLPRPVLQAAQALGLYKDTDSSSRESFILTVLDGMHRAGLDYDDEGNLIPLNEQERQDLAKKNPEIYASANWGDKPFLEDLATDQADYMLRTKGVFSMLLPGPTRLAFDNQRADSAAWQATLKAHGGDYRAALDAWWKTYPNDPSKWFVPAGKTLAGDDSGYGGEPGVRIPPSQLVYQMYRMKGVGDLMRASKQWAALMLVGTDPDVQDEQSFMAFSDLLANGDIRYKTPVESYGSAADGPGWSAYNQWAQSSYALKERLIDKFGSLEAAYDHPGYLTYKDGLSQFFADTYTTNPHWVLSHAEYDQGTDTWDWKSGSYEGNANAFVARKDLEQLVNMDGMQSFPGAVAMKEYIDRTNKLKEFMDRHYIPDINSDRAKDAGLWDKYNKIVMDTIEQAPDTEMFLSKYFGVRFKEQTAPASAASPADPQAALRQVISTGDLVGMVSETDMRWADVPQEQKGAIIKLDDTLWELRNNARESAMTSYEQAQLYSKADEIMNQVYADKPGLMKRWWNSTHTGSEQQDYKEYAATKPMEYWNNFDYGNLAGIKLSKRAQGWLQSWADVRLWIAQQKDKDPTFSASAGYDSINQHVKEILGKYNEKQLGGFDKAVEAANQWGWAIENVLGYGQKDGKGHYRSEADHIWGNFFKLSSQAQAYVNSKHYGGINYGTDEERKAYQSMQQQAVAWVKDMRAHSTAFDQDWRQLQEINGAPIIGSLVLPDDYFGPIGEVNY